MKSVVLMTTLSALLILQQPSVTPDIVVLKFRCGRQQTQSSMISSVQDPAASMNEPVRINQTSRNEPQEVKNRRDIQERRAELHAAEMNAALSTQTNSTLYFYRIQIKNSGNRPIRSFVWQYHPGEELSSTDRQFYCVLNAKPNEKKEYELFSPLAPSRVVDASKPIEKPDEEKKGSVLINKIEYVDGSVWHREGWDIRTFAAEDTKKVAGGKCIGI